MQQHSLKKLHITRKSTFYRANQYHYYIILFIIGLFATFIAWYLFLHAKLYSFDPKYSCYDFVLLISVPALYYLLTWWIKLKIDIHFYDARHLNAYNSYPYKLMEDPSLNVLYYFTLSLGIFCMTTIPCAALLNKIQLDTEAFLNIILLPLLSFGISFLCWKKIMRQKEALKKIVITIDNFPILPGKKMKLNCQLAAPLLEDDFLIFWISVNVMQFLYPRKHQTKTYRYLANHKIPLLLMRNIKVDPKMKENSETAEAPNDRIDRELFDKLPIFFENEFRDLGLSTSINEAFDISNDLLPPMRISDYIIEWNLHIKGLCQTKHIDLKLVIPSISTEMSNSHI